MASSSSSGTAGVGVLSDEGATAMAECIGLLFGRWTALQLAVRNRWGGRDSQANADQLASSVLSWFTRKAARGAGPLDQDELEELLYDAMGESFNADIEDGSVEESYSYMDKLRKTRLAGAAPLPRSKRYRGYDSSSDDESSRSEEDDDGAGPMEVECRRRGTQNPPSPSPMRMDGPPCRLGAAASSRAQERKN
ncbi:unnamed protein product [Miscanthus lutarioriparius]|uniref:Pre-rRNA-processing protein TSR2 n=1 Tax=Miscanthus lutarioriparius TaxID=422564 RepID=A0A811RHE0_9POAL|nr:unnamed protein product [Miscanthus lutarioriparius]